MPSENLKSDNLSLRSEILKIENVRVEKNIYIYNIKT